MKHNIQLIFTSLFLVLAGIVISACDAEDWEADDSLLTDEIHGSLTNHQVVATGIVEAMTHNSAVILLSANHNYKESLEIKPGIEISEYSTLQSSYKFEVDNFNSSACEVKLSYLKPFTIYYYRAYAEADGCYHYGETKSFMTDPDYTPGKAVDLGLSVKWANCNIGASQPEEKGVSFYWGKTLTSFSTDWHAYSLSTLMNQGYIDNNNNLCPKYDTATQIWGSEWRMPTKEEFQELINKCSWKETTKNGVQVYLITGPNSNVIYLRRYGDSWTSSCNSKDSYVLSHYYKQLTTNYRSYYNSIRPVQK